MPTYQYACTNPECGNRFELVQSFTDPAASSCPVCAGPVRKVFSSVGVVFKGSGFYRNDSREGAGNGAAKKESSSTGDSGATKSEPSTPAKTSESTSTSTPSSTGTTTPKVAAAS